MLAQHKITILIVKRSFGLLRVANDAPDTVTIQGCALGLFLVAVELVVGKDLEGKAGAEYEDGQVVGPLQGSREG